MTDEQIKERNKNICKDWVDWHDREQFHTEPVSELKKRISQTYSVAEQYIYQILKENTDLLKQNAEWRKFLRICKLQRLQAGKDKSNKDIVDLLEQERKEIEGNTPLVNLSQHTHLSKTFVYLDKKAMEEETGKNRIKAELPTE